MSDDQTIVIKNWAKHFETAESRKRKGSLAWVALPTSQDGLGYRRICKHERASEVFCGWCLMLECAGKAADRGRLRHTAADLSDMTGFPESTFEIAISVLSDPKIGWITIVDLPESAGICRDLPLDACDSTEPNITEPNTTGHNKTEPKKKKARQGESLSKSSSGNGSTIEVPDSRRGAMMVFAEVVTPFMAKDEPQKSIDQGAMNHWFDTIWPEGAARAEALYRWDRFMEIARDGRAKAKKPMAYIQKRMGEIK